jgi:hypothetical protein
MITFADNFLAGSLLTLLMPIALVIVLAVWYTVGVRRLPKDTPESSSTLPPREVVAAPGSDVHEVTPVDPPDGPA